MSGCLSRKGISSHQGGKNGVMGTEGGSVVSLTFLASMAMPVTIRQMSPSTAAMVPPSKAIWN